MSFWALPDSANVALISTNCGTTTYRQLSERVNDLQETLFNGLDNALGVLFFDPEEDDIAIYLASLNSGNPALLLSSALNFSELALDMIRRYQPAWVFAPKQAQLPEQYELVKRYDEKYFYLNRDSGFTRCHPELALLLATSGSTGSPKLVRLSHRALQANAASIREYLEICAEDVAITSLPLFYSYGLSVLNSHLLVGASIALTNNSILDKAFYDQLNSWKVTSLAGVPFQYQTLLKTGFFRSDWPNIHTFTQAGGKLGVREKQTVIEYTKNHKKRFYVMYGQTEATARMTYVPSDRLEQKLESIGVPIPGGNMRCDDKTGELIYSGANVMMGYATEKAHLLEGDINQGVLYTGDIGRMDDDSFFYVLGRENRFIKLAGHRVALDEVERKLSAEFSCTIVAIGQDNDLIVVIEARDDDSAKHVEERIKILFGFSPALYRVCQLEQFPLNNNGKLDMPALQRACG
jgi:long-chain acyl-CoA synthetase